MELVPVPARHVGVASRRSDLSVDNGWAGNNIRDTPEYNVGDRREKDLCFDKGVRMHVLVFKA